LDALVEARQQMIEAGGRTAETFGVNGLLGRIYVLLYLRPEAACLDEIASDLGVSKASASIACRQLQRWGAIKSVWRKGDRRDFYEAETNLKALLRNGLLEGVNKKLDSAEIQIRECRALLERHGQAQPKAGFVLERLGEAEKLRKKIHSLLNNPLLRKLL
jgi:DNA-binding transcriptional regulator GbsR (MarR family)